LILAHRNPLWYELNVSFEYRNYVDLWNKLGIDLSPPFLFLFSFSLFFFAPPVWGPRGPPHKIRLEGKFSVPGRGGGIVKYAANQITANNKILR
jgi:hypothetical protein